MANVLSGALLQKSFLGDIGEMLVLLSAVVSFIVVVLAKEKEKQAQSSDYHLSSKGEKND